MKLICSKQIINKSSNSLNVYKFIFCINLIIKFKKIKLQKVWNSTKNRWKIRKLLNIKAFYVFKNYKKHLEKLKDNN